MIISTSVCVVVWEFLESWNKDKLDYCENGQICSLYKTLKEIAGHISYANVNKSYRKEGITD